MSCDDYNLADDLSKANSETRRGFGGNFSDKRCIFAGNGRESDEIIGTNGLCAVEFGEWRVICLWSDISKAFICEKNRPVVFNGLWNVYRRFIDVFIGRRLELDGIFLTKRAFRCDLDNNFRDGGSIFEFQRGIKEINARGGVNHGDDGTCGVSSHKLGDIRDKIRDNRVVRDSFGIVSDNNAVDSQEMSLDFNFFLPRRRVFDIYQGERRIRRLLFGIGL